MKDEMKKHSIKEYADAVLCSDFLAWGKSRRKVYNKMRRTARHRMNRELKNMTVEEI